MPNMHERLDRWARDGSAYSNGNEEGLWVALAEGRTYLAVRFDDLWAATGEETGDRYHADVLLIDLDTAEVGAARKCCGADPEEGYADPYLAEMCVRYGSYAPMGQHSGGNLHRVLADALREARDYQRDAAAREDRLDGAPVNALGQSPREYASGMDGMHAALTRGVEAGDRSATVIAKMYNAAGGNTLGGERMPPIAI